MDTQIPARGNAIQLVGYTWGSGELALRWVHWPAGCDGAPPGMPAEPAPWPVVPGGSLALSATGAGGLAERRCVGYRPPEGGRHRTCPDWHAIPPGTRAQCRACERREGRLEIVASDGTRPPTGPRAEYLRSAHEVYLAAFGGGVTKVGVSGAGRTPLRVLEQGAPVGLVVAQADDGMAARRLEHAFSQRGVRERVQVRTKLRLLYPPPDPRALVAELDQLLHDVRASDASWPTTISWVVPPVVLDDHHLLGLDSLDAAPEPAKGPPADDLRGMVVVTAGALIVTRVAQVSLWAASLPAPLIAHDVRTWLGWRVTVGG